LHKLFFYAQLFYPSLKNDETVNVSERLDAEQENVSGDTNDISNLDNPAQDLNNTTSDAASDPVNQSGDPLDPSNICGDTTLPVKSQQDEDDDEDVDSLMGKNRPKREIALDSLRIAIF